jgi:glycerophosphoryl diester phosphodiesterase
MGADFLEQDVVATRDGALVVLHDIHLDRVSDVATRYPDRCRDDGRYYVRDFDLAEVRELAVTERVTAAGEPVYPGRFPVRSGYFRIHTLKEELSFVAGLNRSTGRDVGVYPEIKRPAWHRDNGIDITPAVLAELEEFGYAGRDANVFLQCFDAAELERLRDELDCDLPLVQLIGENDWGEAETDYDGLRTSGGLAQMAGIVDAIGPWLNQLYSADGGAGRPIPGDLADRAHEAGLLVHPYTFRADDLPAGFATFDELVRFFASDVGIDGLFTDFPDRARAILAGQPQVDS